MLAWQYTAAPSSKEEFTSPRRTYSFCCQWAIFYFVPKCLQKSVSQDKTHRLKNLAMPLLTVCYRPKSKPDSICGWYRRKGDLQFTSGCEEIGEMYWFCYSGFLSPQHPRSHTSIQNIAETPNTMWCIASFAHSFRTLQAYAHPSCLYSILCGTVPLSHCHCYSCSLSSALLLFSAPVQISPNHCNCPKAAVLTFTSCTRVLTSSSWHRSCDSWSQVYVYPM